MGSMNLDLPVVATTPVADSAQKLNDALEAVEEHDHSSGQGNKITPAGININTTVDFNSNALTEVDTITLISGSVLNGGSNVYKLYSAASELYFTDGGGSAVKLTNAGQVNIAGTGGWTGDYVATVAEAVYTDSTKTFKLVQDAGASNQAGKLDIGDLQIREIANGVTTYVELKSPTSLASNVSLTLPASLPPSTTDVMTMTTAGVIGTTPDVSIDTLTTTGIITAGGDVTVAGDITLGDGKHVVVSGTGEYKHGDVELMIPAIAGSWEENNSTTTEGHMFSGSAVALSNDAVLVIPITLKVGDRIKSVGWSGWFSGGGTKNFYLEEVHMGTNTLSTHESTSTGDNGWVTGTITASPELTVDTDGVFMFKFTLGNVLSDKIAGIVVTYDHP